MGNTFGRQPAESQKKLAATLRFVSLSERTSLEERRKIFSKSNDKTNSNAGDEDGGQDKKTNVKDDDDDRGATKEAASDEEEGDDNNKTTKKKPGSKRATKIKEVAKKKASDKDNDKDADWKENHFLFKDNSTSYGKCTGVITSSYQSDFLDRVQKLFHPNMNTTTTTTTTITTAATKKSQTILPIWLTFHRALKACPRKFVWDGDISEKTQHFLKSIKAQNAHKFQDCDKLEDILSRVLEIEQLELPDFLKDCDFVKAFSAFSIQQTRKTWYEIIHDIWQKQSKAAARANVDPDASSDSGDIELVLGFGHVRTYIDKKIVNSPLLEVTVQVKKLDDSCLLVCPIEDAVVQLNSQASDAIITAGGGNIEVVNQLRRRIRQTKPKALDPRSSETYRSFLEAARNICCYGEIREADDADIHATPGVPSALVLTKAWCLYARPKISSPYSRDAELLAVALEAGKLKMPRATYAVTEGSDALEVLDRPRRTIRGYISKSQARSDQLVFPLAASRQQRLVAEMLLEQESSVVVAEGPPGCGKTHTIVNCVAAALYQRLQVLVVSSNPHALGAFVDKLSPELRKLCLDMASAEEHGRAGLHIALKRVGNELAIVKEQRDQYAADVKAYQERIKSLKSDLLEIDREEELAYDRKRKMLTNDMVKRVVTRALAVNSRSPSMTMAVFSQNIDIEKTKKDLERLIQDVEDDLKEELSFEFHGEVSSDLLDYVAKEREGSFVSKENGHGRIQMPLPVASIPHLSKLQVDGRVPASSEEWRRAECGLLLRKQRQEFRRDHCLPLVKLGLLEEEIFFENGAIRQGIVELLQEAVELKELFNGLPEEVQQELLTLLSRPLDESNSTRHYQRRELTKAIQDLESHLVSKVVLLGLSKTLQEKTYSNLKLWAHLARDEKCPVEDYTKALRACIVDMPFLVMTNKQVSMYLPENHTFGLAVLDEASQSDCTALSLMMRSEKLLIVGDDMQGSSTEAFKSKVSKETLRAQLPKIPRAQQLLPGSSFFDFCKVALPTISQVFLSDHYRCHPDIISWCNSQFYNGNLEPLRPRSNINVLVDCFVEGERDKKEKTNQAEADEIARRVVELIKAGMKDKSMPEKNTIGIISFGGKSQCKLIRELLAVLLEDLPPSIVERHNIMIGDCVQWQGAERHTVFFSMVYDKTCVNRVQEIEIVDGKKYNVALSRAIKQVVLVRSVKRCDFKNRSDWKCKLIQLFLESTSNEQKREPKRLSLPQKSLSPQETMENFLLSFLEKHGFQVERKGGKVWGDALCIGRNGKSNVALLFVACAWKPSILDQQMSLEGAGWSCLRVDGLSLALRPSIELKEVFDFLAQAGLSDETLLPAFARGANALPPSSNSISRLLDTNMALAPGADTVSPYSETASPVLDTAASKRKSSTFPSVPSVVPDSKRSKFAASSASAFERLSPSDISGSVNTPSDSESPHLSVASVSVTDSSEVPFSLSSKRKTSATKEYSSLKKIRPVVAVAESHSTSRQSVAIDRGVAKEKQQEKTTLKDAAKSSVKAQEKTDKTSRDDEGKAKKDHNDVKALMKPFENGDKDLADLNKLTKNKLADIIRNHFLVKPKGLSKMSKEGLVAEVSQLIQKEKSGL